MGVILVRIFPHSDWIRKDTLYLYVFPSKCGNIQKRITPTMDTFHAVLRHGKSKILKFGTQIQQCFTDILQTFKYYFPWKCIFLTASRVSKYGVFWSVFSCIWTKYGDLRINLRIESKHGKIRTRKTPYLDSFDAVADISSFYGCHDLLFSKSRGFYYKVYM